MWFRFIAQSSITSRHGGVIADVVRWAAPRLAIYVTASVCSGLSFLICAAVYSYFLPPPHRVYLPMPPLAQDTTSQAPSVPPVNSNPSAPRPSTNTSGRPVESNPTIAATSAGTAVGRAGGAIVVAREWIEIKRNGDDVTVAIKIRNPYGPLKIIVRKEDAELYTSGKHWFANASFGIPICDFTEECTTNEVIDQRAAILAANSTQVIEFKFSVDKDPLVGSLVTFRLRVVTKDQADAKNRWYDDVIYEPDVLVQTGCVADGQGCDRSVPTAPPTP
jgi:hypothetical protein